MADLPMLALRVADVQRSLAFYTVHLGFTASGQALPTTCAEVLDFDGEPLVVAQQDGDDPAPWLQPQHVILQPGAVVGFSCADVAQQITTWQARGLMDITQTTSGWGDPMAIVRDPDGYLLRFTVQMQRSPEQIVAGYARGPDAVAAALAGLDAAHLDLARLPGEWTIRQIVHHISDGHDLWASAIKAALANSGCQYRHDWYTPDNVCAQTLDYAGRDIGPALDLLRANTNHINQLVGHLPDALDRFIMFAWPWEEAPSRITVLDSMRGQAYHTFAHCDEIALIRSANRV
jgi:catechol 2,3-dioxygenase-like lactoylglutathione lyase family enzyme